VNSPIDKNICFGYDKGKKPVWFGTVDFFLQSFCYEICHENRFWLKPNNIKMEGTPMKKILAIILVLSVLLFNVAMAEDLLQEMDIAFLPKSVGGAWFTRMYEGGIEVYAAESGSTSFQSGPSAGDAAAQNRCVQDAVAGGVEVIAVCPFSPEQIDADLGKAREDGIIVISNEGSTLVNIDYDIEAFKNADFGAMAADKMAQGMGEEGEIIVFVGSLASTAHVGWAQAIVDRMTEAYPNIAVANEGGVFIETGNNAANSYEKAKEALKAYPNAKACFCPSSTDTPSIALAIQEAGLTNQITYVAVGLPNATRTYIEDGSIDVLMSWDPGEVAQAMCRAAAAVKTGRELKTGDDLGVFGFNSIIVEDKVITGTEWRMITAENVGEYNY
jgi:simple sugar transport system substrate-binding protein